MDDEDHGFALPCRVRRQKTCQGIGAFSHSTPMKANQNWQKYERSMREEAEANAIKIERNYSDGHS